MITKPLLPPKNGYVEVEVDGERTYRNVKTGLLIDEETLNTEPTTEEVLNAMLGVTENE